MQDLDFMRSAISKAKEGIDKGQSPFGACIVKDGNIISCCHNMVWGLTDITAHAEILAIREACKKLNKVELKRAFIYSTTEPCPMCFTAIHWAKIEKIIYGTSIEDAKIFGFSELTISNRDMKRTGGSEIEIISGCLREESLELFKCWAKKVGKRVY
jgi:guanine deaminase